MIQFLSIGEEKLPKTSQKKAETKVGQYIEQVAQERNLSLRQLSHNASLNEATLAHIVSGRRKADIDVCVKLAQYLKIDPCYLLELADRIPYRENKESSPEIRELIYRLNHLNYSHDTLSAVKAILDQTDKNRESREERNISSDPPKEQRLELI
jgi:transcriptional regulator with XRE-family HTH domain